MSAESVTSTTGLSGGSMGVGSFGSVTVTPFSRDWPWVPVTRTVTVRVTDDPASTSTVQVTVLRSLDSDPAGSLDT